MYNFIKQKHVDVERIVEYINCQEKIAILNNFWQKDGGRIQEMKKLKEKK